MTKFQQIMSALKDGAEFSWGFNGISSPEPPKDNLQAICDLSDEGQIGYHIQIYLARALYFEDLRITFTKDGGNIKIYY
jgi:hypothetical protein